MPEDQLTRAERIRLESFAQAVNAAATLRYGGEGWAKPSDLFTLAELIEGWLKRAKEDA